MESERKGEVLSLREAIGHGMLCAALDVMVDYEMLRESDIEYAKELLARIIPMLINLIKLFEGGAPNRARPSNRPSTSPGTSPESRARAPSP